jgi:Flp pilus assembly protein TadD
MTSRLALLLILIVASAAAAFAAPKATPTPTPTPSPKGSKSKTVRAATSPTPSASPKSSPSFKSKPAALRATPAPKSTPSVETSGPKPGQKLAPAPESKTDLNLADVPTAGSAEAQDLAQLAMLEFRRGDLARARKNFEKALDIVPGNSAILINLGLIDYREKKYDAAEQRLKKLLRNDPDAALGWLILGIVYYDQEKFEYALAALAQAAILAPKDPRVHQYLGVTLGRKGWYLGAEDEMRKAIELQPDYAEANYNLAVFYLQRNPPAVELARRHYLKALDLGAAPDPEMSKKLGE